MKKNYEIFLQILKEWPPNANRIGRDYGFRLREIANNHLASGNPFPGSTEENSVKLDSLKALVSNKYWNKYKYNLKFGASGINFTELRKIMDDQFIESYNSRKFKF